MPKNPILTGLVEFDEFWADYPNKDAKKEAEKAWRKLNPSPELAATMRKELAWQKTRAKWLKNGGEYVPHAATWIRGERWKDEKPTGGNGRPPLTPAELQMAAEIRAQKRHEFMTGADAMAEEYYRTHPMFRPSKPS